MPGLLCVSASLRQAFQFFAISFLSVPSRPDDDRRTIIGLRRELRWNGRDTPVDLHSLDFSRIQFEERRESLLLAEAVDVDLHLLAPHKLDVSASSSVANA